MVGRRFCLSWQLLERFQAWRRNSHLSRWLSISGLILLGAQVGKWKIEPPQRTNLFWVVEKLYEKWRWCSNVSQWLHLWGLIRKWWKAWGRSTNLPWWLKIGGPVGSRWTIVELNLKSLDWSRNEWGLLLCCQPLSRRSGVATIDRASDLTRYPVLLLILTTCENQGHILYLAHVDLVW